MIILPKILFCSLLDHPVLQRCVLWEWWTMETWKFPWCHSTCRRAEQQSAAGTALLLATCTSPLLHVCVDVDCKSRTFCISVGEYVRGSCPGAPWWQHPANIMSTPGSRPAVDHQTVGALPGCSGAMPSAWPHQQNRYQLRQHWHFRWYFLDI